MTKNTGPATSGASSLLGCGTDSAASAGDHDRWADAMRELFETHDRAMKGDFESVEDIYCLLLYKVSCLKRLSEAKQITEGR
jgi:hypothetical protein